MSDVTKDADSIWEQTAKDGEWIDVSRDFPEALRLNEVGELFTGVVNSIKTVRQGKKRRKVKVVVCTEQDTGQMWSVWQSASLNTLMSRIRVGDTLAIQYLGERKLSKKRSIRDYRSAIKRG